MLQTTNKAFFDRALTGVFAAANSCESFGRWVGVFAMLRQLSLNSAAETIVHHRIGNTPIDLRVTRGSCSDSLAQVVYMVPGFGRNVFGCIVSSRNLERIRRMRSLPIFLKTFSVQTLGVNCVPSCFRNNPFVVTFVEELN